MAVPVGLNVWSKLTEDTFPYLDRTAHPFDSLWFPSCVATRCSATACNPALLAKMAATTQAISGGRTILGIGAGWNEEEYRAYGWPFPPAKVRIAQLAEAIELIRAMWTQAPASYAGEHYRISNAGTSATRGVSSTPASSASCASTAARSAATTPPSRRCFASASSSPTTTRSSSG